MILVIITSLQNTPIILKWPYLIKLPVVDDTEDLSAALGTGSELEPSDEQLLLRKVQSAESEESESSEQPPQKKAKRLTSKFSVYQVIYIACSTKVYCKCQGP